MHPRNGTFLITLLCILAATAAGASQEEPKLTQSPDPRQELVELVRRTQDLAEQSQAELKRAREQNESLQRLLEQTHQELIQLREELRLLRSNQPAAQLTATGEPATTGPARPSNDESGQKSNSGEAGAGLAERLTRVEDQVELNTAQIKEHAQTKVESDSRLKLRLFGTILDNTYFNTSGGPGAAVPTAAPPRTAPADDRGHNLGATLRQTEFGFSMTGPKLGTARLSADIDFDFFGGAAESYGSNVLGELRMRTASARLDGSLTSLAIGLMAPMISPLNPTSLAAVYYPALGESGNLWQWRPQLVLERRATINEEDSVVIQGGLMMPFGDTVNGRALEGRPGYESRVAFARRLDAERRLEFGIGGYFAPQRFDSLREVDSYAATGDWQLPLTNRLELSGEAYFGQSIGLGAQSGEDHSSAFSFTGPLDDPKTAVRGVHSFGGWTQLRARALPQLEFNLAFGIDDPRNRDIFAGLFDRTTRLKNQTASINSIYRLRSNFLISLEYRHLWSTYPDGRTSNDHVNLAIGYLF
ncbi:MAG TPA: hypothetical protein VE398_22475 [Acidobacteriota bacterium]|nr:hypothetical protein [Acidobacteriota bacterium]